MRLFTEHCSGWLIYKLLFEVIPSLLKQQLYKFTRQYRIETNNHKSKNHKMTIIYTQKPVDRPFSSISPGELTPTISDEGSSLEVVPEFPPQLLAQIPAKLAALDIKIQNEGPKPNIALANVDSLVLDEQKIKLSIKIAKKIKEEFEYSKKLKEDYNFALKELRDKFKIDLTVDREKIKVALKKTTWVDKLLSQNIQLSDEELDKKISLLLARREDFSTLPNKELWEKANGLRKKIAKQKIQPDVDFIEFDTFKKLVHDKFTVLQKEDPLIDINSIVDEELISLTAYNALERRGGCFKRFPYHFFEKDKNLDVKAKTLIAYFLKEVRDKNNSAQILNSYEDSLEQAGLGKLFEFYRLDELLSFVVPDKNRFKKNFAEFLSENGLGKIMSRETGREFIFTRSQLIKWYKKYQQDNGQSFLKGLEANNLTESFKHFANGNLTKAFVVLFGEEETIKTAPKMPSIQKLAKGDVFVYRFDVNMGSGEAKKGMWVSIIDAASGMIRDEIR